MVKLTEDIKVKNFTDFKTKLTTYLSVKEETIERLIETIGGSNKLMNAVFDGTIDSGCAYDGSFIKNALRLTSYAIKINDLLPEGIKAEKKSIVKVGLLGQIAKVIMYEPNDNSWEVTNRGIVYKYVDLPGALRVGERSTLIVMNGGIRLSPEEYEAFKILDKNVEQDTYSQKFSTSLSMVIKQANEMLLLVNRDTLNK